MCPKERKARRAAAKAKAAASGKGGRKGNRQGKGKGRGAGRGRKRKAEALVGDQAEGEPSEVPDAGPEVPAVEADAESAVAPANDVAMPVPADDVVVPALAAGAPVEEQASDAVAGAEAAFAAVVVEGQPAAAAAAPPFEEPSAAARVEEPQGAAAASSGSRPALPPRVVASRGPNMHTTPGVLAELAPPTCYKLRLSYNDHRFKAEVLSEAEQRRIGAKSFSRSFAANNNALWRDVLAETHRWAWRHWLASPDAHRGNHQVPGQIPQTVLDTLGPIIEAMPEPRVYNR